MKCCFNFESDKRCRVCGARLTRHLVVTDSGVEIDLYCPCHSKDEFSFAICDFGTIDDYIFSAET